MSEQVHISAEPQKIAILGCGLVGASWAALFLHYGFNVRAWDPDTVALETLADRIKGPMFQLQSLGEGAKNLGNLNTFSEMGEAIQGVTFVQENAPEVIDLKKELYRKFEVFSPPEALIASSASSFVWSVLSADMRAPNRLLTAHPFNPPHLIPLVEMYCPSKDTLDFAEKIYLSIGRVPIRLKREATGHIANRLAWALWREAVNIVSEGIADVDVVDAALIHGPGLRWAVTGAQMTYHLGGGSGGMNDYLQHLGPSQELRWADLGTPNLSPEVCATLIAGVDIQAQGKTVAELEQIRDDGLLRILTAWKSKS